MHLFLSFLIICAGIIWMEIKDYLNTLIKRTENFYCIHDNQYHDRSCKIFRLPLPNPSDWVEAMFQPLSHLLFRWIT